jgi:hypothetical protein
MNSYTLSLRERAGVRACSKSDYANFMGAPPYPNPLPEGEGTGSLKDK